MRGGGDKKAAFDPEGIYEILADKLGVDRSKITLDASLQDDLGADSLDAVELVMNIEEKYKIEIPDEVAHDFTYVKDILDYVKKHYKP